MKKEKEKEPEKLDKMENSAVPKKKGFEEEHKDSDDDSSDDEQVRPLTVGDRCRAQKVEVLPVGTMVEGFYDLSTEMGWAV